MTDEDELSPDLIEEIQALEKLENGDLWRLARGAMSLAASQELEALNNKQRDEGLSLEEVATHAKLIHEYERVMLVRAKAAVLLKDRGHDISGILGRPCRSSW